MKVRKVPFLFSQRTSLCYNEQFHYVLGILNVAHLFLTINRFPDFQLISIVFDSKPSVKE